MKTILLRHCAIFSVGASLLVTAGFAHADDPQVKRRSSTEKSSDVDANVTAKPHRTKHTPSVDGRNSTTTSAKSTMAGGANGRETEVPTGSHLPKTYQRKGYTTNDDPTTFTYDRDDIRLRNSNTVSDSLRQVPGVTIGGRR